MPNENILFLDDDEARIKSFKAVHPNAVIVTTASDCIEKLQTEERWDRVFLDHDLGGEIFVDSARDDCGMEVVRWICDNEPSITIVLVHTCNTRAGANMVNALRDDCYTAVHVPFPTMEMIW